MNKKLKIYLDTSVINFLFADDAPEKRDVTIDFFENYLDDYDIYISNIVINEILKTKNQTKMDLLLNSISKFNLEIYAIENEEIIDLSNIYLEKTIVPKNQNEDAKHLAYATYYEFDILLSWNFKHLANILVQTKLNSINISLGYNKILRLTNPMELVYEK